MPLNMRKQNISQQGYSSVGSDINLPIQAQLTSQLTAISEMLDSSSRPFSSINGMIAFEKIPQPLRAYFTNAATTALAQSPSDSPEAEYATRIPLSATGVP